jgi:hypothetical protein
MPTAYGLWQKYIYSQSRMYQGVYQPLPSCRPIQLPTPPETNKPPSIVDLFEK